MFSCFFKKNIFFLSILICINSCTTLPEKIKKSIRVGDFEKGLFEFMDSKCPELLKVIADKKVIDDEVKGGLDKAIKEYSENFV